MKRIFLDIFLLILMVVFASDILYLYFAGGWIEPNKSILYTELIILPLTIILGIVRIVWKMVELINDNPKSPLEPP